MMVLGALAHMAHLLALVNGSEDDLSVQFYYLCHIFTHRPVWPFVSVYCIPAGCVGSCDHSGRKHWLVGRGCRCLSLTLTPGSGRLY